MLSTEPASISSRQAGPFPDQLRLAVIAYLARFKGSSREHTESDLRCYLNWCAGHDLDPMAAQRPHLELYIRWMQETRRLTRAWICAMSRSLPVTRTHAPRCVTTGSVRTWTAIPTTSSPLSWPPAPDQRAPPAARPRETHCIAYEREILSRRSFLK